MRLGMITAMLMVGTACMKGQADCPDGFARNNDGNCIEVGGDEAPTPEPDPDDEQGGGAADEGKDVGGAQDGGSTSSGMGGTNSLYIVNDSSFDLCYIAACDCNIERCGEDVNFFVPSGYYTEFGGLEDQCVYIYTEDCEYGVYWEDFFEMTGDFTWTVTD